MSHRAKITRNRINRVVNRLHGLCDHEWTLAELASTACLSKYHFLRVFESVLRETPGKFLQRIRLERAARMLVYNRHSSITEIAHACGYGSSQSLARAFRSRYLISPGGFRQVNVYRISKPVIRAEPDRTSDHDTRVMRETVSVIHQPRCRVAYIRHLGCYGAPRLDAFGQLRQWISAHALRDMELPVYGIGWDNNFITPDAQCRYDVGVPVPDDIESDEVVDVQTIPEGTYAVFRTRFIRGSGLIAWERFIQNWLPQSGYQFDFRPSYERYIHDSTSGPGPDMLVDMCLAVIDLPATAKSSRKMAVTSH